MDYMNQQNAPQREPGQAAQPQPGGYYQFQPGVGFVQVFPEAGAGTAGGGQQPGMGTTDPNTLQAGMQSQGTPDGAQPKFDQQKLGKMYSTVNEVMNGDADPSSLISLFAESSGDFWKGALVGAAALVLLNNDAVKGTLGGLIGSVGSMFGEKDPDGEQVTVGGK